MRKIAAVIFAHYFNVKEIVTARFDNLGDLGGEFGVNHCVLSLDCFALPLPCNDEISAHFLLRESA